MKFIAILLGASLFGILITGDSNPFQPFLDTVGSGPNLPQYEDPTSLGDYVAVRFIPLGISNDTALYPDSVTGCSMSNYSDCVDTADGSQSYITFNGSLSTDIVAFEVIAIPDFASDIILTRVALEIQYRSGGLNDDVEVGFMEAVNPPSSWQVILPDTSLPPTDGTFLNLSFVRQPVFPFNFSYLRDNVLSAPTQMFIDFDVFSGSPDYAMDVSYLKFSMYASGEPECSVPAGAWFPIADKVACSIQNFVNLLVDFFVFLVSGLVWFFSSLIATAVWIVSIISTLVTGVAGLFSWFLNLDAPPLVNSVFAAFLAIPALLFIFTLIRFFRGSEG